MIFLGPAFRGEGGLKVFGVNACFCPLLPGHLWSLRPVHLYELRLGWPSYARCVDVAPARDTTYTLTAEDANGNKRTATLTIRVR